MGGVVGPRRSRLARSARNGSSCALVWGPLPAALRPKPASAAAKAYHTPPVATPRRPPRACGLRVSARQGARHDRPAPITILAPRRPPTTGQQHLADLTRQGASRAPGRSPQGLSDTWAVWLRLGRPFSRYGLGREMHGMNGVPWLGEASKMTCPVQPTTRHRGW